MENTDVTALVAKLQDDIVYVLEELLFDCTGEARTELGEILARLDGQAALLGPRFTGRLRERLEPALAALRAGAMRDACLALQGLRRGLRNCQLQMRGLPQAYPYGTELGLPDRSADSAEVGPSAHSAG